MTAPIYPIERKNASGGMKKGKGTEEVEEWHVY
jgi:hypothetical protein